MSEGTHVTHCCFRHGCKYMDYDEGVKFCPVANGTMDQEFPCEVCSWMEEIDPEPIMSLAEAVEHLAKTIEDVMGDEEVTMDEKIAIYNKTKRVLEKLNEKVGP